MSSFQRGGIEELHCIQRCFISGGWNRGVPLYTGVSSLQEVGFHCTQRCPRVIHFTYMAAVLCFSIVPIAILELTYITYVVVVVSKCYTLNSQM